MKFIVALLILVNSVAYSEDWGLRLSKYLLDNTDSPDIDYSLAQLSIVTTENRIEIPVFEYWRVPNLEQPSIDTLLAQTNLDVVYENPRFRKKVDGKWVSMTQEEKDAILEAEVAARQDEKTLEQKTYENQFFTLTEQLLTVSSDPRAGQTPPIKLSFPEIDSLIEALFNTDANTATRISVKMLSIDSTLKRYNVLWWDEVIQHDIP